MSNSKFSDAIGGGGFVTIVQCTPPKSADSQKMRDCATASGKAMVVCASESSDGPRMSSLAACVHIAQTGAEPMLTLLTRDANRIAIQSEVIGAASLGINSILVTTGRHQALTDSKSAKGVYDIDPTQFVRIVDGMRKEIGSDIVIGTDTNPFSEPLELMVLALDAAASAGADFVVTWPVFDLDRFKAWMDAVKKRNIHNKTRILAGVMPLVSADEAAKSGYDVPADLVARVSSDKSAGIQAAVETVKALRGIDGVAGVFLMTGENPELARDVIDASGVVGS